ncbi:heme-binding protein [Neobacillus niacini]|uniref:GlcG/HbpS family heme-binding protein n=1 Tax=Neobacillus niacini TaxID=86668 RepID=UPI002FFF7185
MKYLEKYAITNDLAKKMINAAEEKAKELEIAVNITIVDDGGNLVSFSRMDYAPLLSVGISQNKAYSAIAFGKPTSEWYPMIKDEPALLNGIVHTPKLVIFGGGFPIEVDGKVIGGIGVSGGSAEQDELCCKAALKLIE